MGQAWEPRDKGARKVGLEDTWLTYDPCGFQARGKGQTLGCLAGMEGREPIVLTDKNHVSFPLSHTLSSPFTRGDSL